MDGEEYGWMVVDGDGDDDGASMLADLVREPLLCDNHLLVLQLSGRYRCLLQITRDAQCTHLSAD